MTAIHQARTSGTLLPDGRLHLQHGPIDLVIGATGAGPEIERAYVRACARFEGLLEELVAELPLLRTACPATGLGLKGPVARRMEQAVRLHADVFVTPMAAVAGAVADEVLTAMLQGRTLPRASVNNGGDIAFRLALGETMVAGLVADPRDGRLAGRCLMARSGGIATSGRHGRSFSLGIADAVTVFAGTAAAADAAATLIANAVDLPGSGKVARVPAAELAPDSDLGERPITVDVKPLTTDEIATALDNGEEAAGAMLDRRLITGVALMLGGVMRIIGDVALLPDGPSAGKIAATQRREPEHA